jgi:hypothetical protein
LFLSNKNIKFIGFRHDRLLWEGFDRAPAGAGKS